MQSVRRVTFEEVRKSFQHENRASDSYQWTDDELEQADKQFNDKWTLVRLSRTDILNIMLPRHEHGIELIPHPGLAVSAAVERLRMLLHQNEIEPCLKNISSHKGRDFSETHVFLKFEDGRLKHLDGLHRLLAWVFFEKNDDVPAYVAGEATGEAIFGT